MTAHLRSFSRVPDESLFPKERITQETVARHVDAGTWRRVACPVCAWHAAALTRRSGDRTYFICMICQRFTLDAAAAHWVRKQRDLGTPTSLALLTGLSYEMAQSQQPVIVAGAGVAARARHGADALTGRRRRTAS